MKYLFVFIMCAAGALSLVSCGGGDNPEETAPGGSDPAPPATEAQTAEEALAQAKKEALDAANEAVALKIQVQANTAHPSGKPLPSVYTLQALYDNADSALRQAKAATTVEEANQAKALAEETRRRLQSLSDITGTLIEEPDTPIDD